VKFMTDISNKDSEQDVHKRIDRTEERVTKLNEDVRERIRALEKWVWGAGAVLTAFIIIGGIVGDLDIIPDREVTENAS